jgi:hypothetical protein
MGADARVTRFLWDGESGHVASQCSIGFDARGEKLVDQRYLWLILTKMCAH